MYRIQLQHKDFMVINKRPGIGMHDDAGEPGLVNRVRMDTGLDLYPVHRLDKMTSGLVLLARTAEANRALSMAFAAREVSKQYLALSDRKPKKKQGWVKGDMEKGRGGSWMLSRTQDNPAIRAWEPPSSGMSVTAARWRIAVICTPGASPSPWQVRVSISSVRPMRGHCSSCPSCMPPSQNSPNERCNCECLSPRLDPGRLR